MVHYCPHCWQEIPAGARGCPHCNLSTDETGRTFVERLMASLQHPEPTRAGLAIDILANRLREPRAVGALIDLLETAGDVALLVQAARGLGELGDRRAVGPLARLLARAQAPFVARREAALALGRLGGQTAEAHLRAALGDPRSSVAQAARRALGMPDEEKSA
jgi:HEAT repeat protein